MYLGVGSVLRGPRKELPSDSWIQPSGWVGGEIIPFILALVCLITSLAVLFVAATGVSFVTQMTRASQHLWSFLTCIDLQYCEVSYPTVVSCPGD